MLIVALLIMCGLTATIDADVGLRKAAAKGRGISSPKTKVDVPECTCDDRGTQEDSKDGDWCWLKETPCLKRNGSPVSDSYTWLRCEHNGEIQVNCPGPEKPPVGPRSHISGVVYSILGRLGSIMGSKTANLDLASFGIPKSCCPCGDCPTCPDNCP